MKSLHIRDVDPDIIKKLQILAKIHHRSMQGELRAVLTEASRRASAVVLDAELDLVTVNTGNESVWNREDYYNDAR